jgi:biotin carboxylase
MQQVCLTLDITTLNSHVIDSLDALKIAARDIGYPVVVKPVDNQGSRGVRRVDKEEEVETAFREAHRYTSTGEILVEELFDGREIVIEGFSLDGSFINLIVGDRTYFNITGRFIPQATLFPTNLPYELKDRLLNINNRLVKGFGLPFGITHSEYLMNEQTGEIRLIEVAARGGGVFISSDLIPLCCGLDVNELLIQRSLGASVVMDYTSISEAAASGYICFTLPEGVIDQPPNIKEVEEIEGVHRTYLEDLTPGKKIHYTKDKTMRMGPILIRAESREGLDKIHKRVQQVLHITVSTPEGVRGPIWS